MARKDLEIENAKIIFRNFSGAGSAYNPAGRRTFSVVVSEEDAIAMRADGWNVKEIVNDDGDSMFHLSVTVAYANVPPTVWLLTDSSEPVLMNEKTIGELDFATLENVDLVISPYHWTMNNKEGIKAYLKSGYFTIHEDRFRSKYADKLNSIKGIAHGEEEFDEG